MRKGRVPIVVAGVAIAVLSVFLPKDLARVHNYVYTTVVPLLVVAVSFVVYLHTRGELKRVALAVLLYSSLNWLGEITWNYYEIVGLNPFPSLADVFWISAYIPLIYVLLTMLRRGLRYVDLKGYVISAFFVALLVAIALIPAARTVRSLTPLEAFVSILYITLDLVLIPVLILLFFAYAKMPMGFVYGAVILAATLTLVGDILFSYYEAWGIYYTGSLPDIFYNLSYLALLLAMWDVSEGLEIPSIDEIEKERSMLRFLTKLIRHDILNDLSAILGYVERYESTGDPEILKKLKSMLMNSIELVRSIRAVEENPELKPVNLRDVIMRVVSGYDADIRVDVPDVCVLADDLLSSVFRNLVVNAIMHCKERPRIEITAEKVNGWVEIRVADNGPGIPDWMKEEVFREGLGAHTGLGLYIVKRIVEGYGGRIRVEDNEPKGSVFVILLRSA